MLSHSNIHSFLKQGRMHAADPVIIARSFSLLLPLLLSFTLHYYTTLPILDGTRFQLGETDAGARSQVECPR